MSAVTEPLHPVIHRAFASLSDAGVRWAILRMPRSLLRPDGDIDLLVHPGDLDRAVTVMRSLGFVPIAGASSSRPLLAYDDATGDWIHLDVTAHLPAAEGDHGLVASVLDRRRQIDELWRLDPADEFWSLVAHLAQRGRVEDRHRVALREARKGFDTSALAPRLAARVPDGRAWITEVRHSVEAGEWQRLEDALAVLAAAMRRRGEAPSTRHVIGRAWAAWTHRGISVALLGPDGAGKSTLAACIAQRSFFATRVIYMGTGVPGELTARPASLRFLRGPVLFSVGGIATQWLRYLVALRERLRGRLVVFDRYTEEAWLPASPSDPAWRRLGRRVRRVLACPPPDVAIVLDVPGDVMHARKGEHDPHWLDAERQRYRSLARRLRHASLVDGLQPAEEVCAEAMRGIWGAYRRRWAKRR